MLFPQENCASRLCASSQEGEYPLEKTLTISPIKSEREALLVGKEANTYTKPIRYTERQEGAFDIKVSDKCYEYHGQELGVLKVLEKEGRK